MAPRTKTFKNCVIAYTDDIHHSKRDKIKGWVEHAGGRVSKGINDDVTHFIISKRDWSNYKRREDVREARRKRTIYLMRVDWIEDSLILNKNTSKPLNECDSKYTFEVDHAKKVIRHRDKEKAEKKREIARAKTLATKQEQEQLTEEKAHDTGLDDTPAEGTAECITVSDQDPQDRDESTSSQGKADNDIARALGRKVTSDGVHKSTTRAGSSKVADRFQEVFECGVKFDKSVLETERNMALAGYRPYIDSNGRVYLIMLARNDIVKVMQEQYQLKPSDGSAGLHHQHNLSLGVHGTMYTDALTRRRRRGRKRSATKFEAGKDTFLRYFEEPIYRHKSGPHQHARNSIDRLNDGQCTPNIISSDDMAPCGRPCQTLNHLRQNASIWTEFQQWDQRLPFSSLPVMPYTPVSATLSHVRVSLPRPFAYTLQLYESFDRSQAVHQPEQSSMTSSSEDEKLFSAVSSAASTSFMDYLPQSHAQDKQFSEARPGQSSIFSASAATKSLDPVKACPPQAKSYMAICQYTKKGTSRASETMTLAPEGSTFEFAMDIFRKFFRKKTGVAWDDPKSGSRLTNGDLDLRTGSKRDSGVSFGDIEEARTSKSPLDNVKEELDHMSDSSGTFRGDDPAHITHKNFALSDGANDLTNRGTLSLPVADTSTNLQNATYDGLPDIRTEPSTTSTLSPDKAIKAATSQHFTYVRTSKKSYKDANEKYKALYGEDLFVFGSD